MTHSNPMGVKGLRWPKRASQGKAGILSTLYQGLQPTPSSQITSSHCTSDEDGKEVGKRERTGDSGDGNEPFLKQQALPPHPQEPALEGARGAQASESRSPHAGPSAPARLATPLLDWMPSGWAQRLTCSQATPQPWSLPAPTPPPESQAELEETMSRGGSQTAPSCYSPSLSTEPCERTGEQRESTPERSALSLQLCMSEKTVSEKKAQSKVKCLLQGLTVPNKLLLLGYLTHSIRNGY